MSDYHLWPARPGYLRRGTPVTVDGYHGLAWSEALDDPWRVYVSHSTRHRADGYALLVDVRLDLRDVTARAHAAWAWTRVYVVAAALRADIWPEEKGVCTAACTLRRMAAGDPTVTVAKARAALGWAEGVSDE